MMEINRPSGFTLIEMAVGLFLLTILLGSLLVPLSTQVEARQIAETKRQMEEIKEALIGFAVVNGYLPCPDLTTGANSNDGQEDTSGSVCASNYTSGQMSSGNLPWSTLGLGSEDVWGNRYKYVVNERYARRSPSVITLSNTGTYVRVCDSSTTCGTPITANAIAVIISHGSNRLGAINSSNGTQIDASTAGTDESENLDTDRDIVQRTQSNVTSGGGVFDDIIAWIPQYVLLNRMVTAGKLP